MRRCRRGRGGSPRRHRTTRVIAAGRKKVSGRGFSMAQVSNRSAPAVALSLSPEPVSAARAPDWCGCMKPQRVRGSFAALNREPTTVGRPAGTSSCGLIGPEVHDRVRRRGAHRTAPASPRRRTGNRLREPARRAGFRLDSAPSRRRAGARGGIRTLTPSRAVDFESTVSAIPPPGRGRRNEREQASGGPRCVVD